ncbi:hypothetical protein Vi05172_g2335 [Venturia inaequalis]|nr:hypothetical protein Vi05172_g2335 [Venturia inaequalis]
MGQLLSHIARPLSTALSSTTPLTSLSSTTLSAARYFALPATPSPAFTPSNLNATIKSSSFHFMTN